ncbi:homeodomain-interacting protein kinase 2-like [Thalassophryne amazonica]|uniref:homeodomain-interacting protein kinase 2-like n=1 Tax=Thalassophryne amazonica TaxID=390379 RepID=UPI001472294B|nr:homeodomain-interacting protein kinase 2-like [Thalassophryne amazonica]
MLLCSSLLRAPEVHLGLAYVEEIDMWALGVSVAELAIGTALYPGEHPYDMIKFIVETQGLPPDHLLRLGPHTNHCFERQRINGQDTWTLKTPALVKMETGHKFSDTRQVVLTCLEDIMEMMDTNTTEKEGREFVDLLKHMMNLNSEQRIRPADVLKHPFLEENHLEKDVEEDTLEKNMNLLSGPMKLWT